MIAAVAVEALLAAPETGFVLVTSPRRDAMEEAEFFSRQLERNGQKIDALIVNRVHPRFGDEAPTGLRAAAAQLARVVDDPAAHRLAARYENLADFREIAELERAHVEGVQARVGATTVGYVPYLARDVYDFSALREIGGSCSTLRLVHHRSRRPSLGPDDDDSRSRRRASGSATRCAPRSWGPAKKSWRSPAAKTCAAPSTSSSPISSCSTSRSATWAASRSRSTSASRSRAAGCPRARILLLLDRRDDAFIARRADVDLTLVKPVDAGVLRARGRAAARRRGRRARRARRPRRAGDQLSGRPRARRRHRTRGRGSCCCELQARGRDQRRR